ncbi:MAG: HAD family hydrolase [Halobacteriaceae archaeon]
MDRYDRLYTLYEEVEVGKLRDHQEFVDLFPPVDSQVALSHWEEASEELARRKREIQTRYRDGETLADVAAHATREQAFAALDLYTTYDRAVNVLVLDIDETLRSAGTTDNEIPRETLHLLTEFHERGVPIVVCTGQTLENVKGFTIQGLGNAIVHSGTVSIVYEAGSGVFTPGHGGDTKQLLYEDLDETVQEAFATVRSRVLSDAPERIRRGCHLQGNEFNVTLKPNYETGSDDAVAVIDEALGYLLDLLGETAPDATPAMARAHYAAEDPEIEAALDEVPEAEVSDAAETFFERVEVAYYEGDAAEMASRELHKANGVEAALDVLGVEDPFALVMGDSKSDLRVMEWAEEHDAGIAAAPDHSSPGVLDHVRSTDDLVFDQGDAVDVLRTVYALNALADAE